MNWMIAANQLDKDQQAFLRAFDTDRQLPRWWIKGFAGSGKSVLLVHALLNAIENQPDGRYIIVLYTHSLIDLFKTGLPRQVAAKVDVITYHQFMYRVERSTPHYDVIFVDEVQDLPSNVVTALKAHATRVLVAGDQGQSIYDDGASPAEIESILSPRLEELTIVHRLSRRIVEMVNKLFPGKGLTRATINRGVIVQIDVAEAATEPDEIAYIWQRAVNAVAPGMPCVILLPQHKYIGKFANALLHYLGKPEFSGALNKDYVGLNAHLAAHRVPLMYEGNKECRNLAETVRAGKVLLMTYHSAKGLDFETVFIPYLNSSLEIWGDSARADTMFYVALTRSRLNLFISYTGWPHPYLRNIPDTGVRRHKVPAPAIAGAAAVTEEFIF